MRLARLVAAEHIERCIGVVRAVVKQTVEIIRQRAVGGAVGIQRVGGIVDGHTRFTRAGAAPASTTAPSTRRDTPARRARSDPPATAAWRRDWHRAVLCRPESCRPRWCRHIDCATRAGWSPMPVYADRTWSG